MMQTRLPNGVATSRLGFGGAVLMGGGAAASSRRLLDAAYEAGIRHFDVAPIYGLGLAEDVLGEWLRSRSDDVTVTTKVGLARPRAVKGLAKLRGVARKLLGAAPGLRQALGRQVYQLGRRSSFQLDEVRASFADSLRRLGRDRLDVLLLHDAQPGDLTPELIDWLSELRETGAVGAVGFGLHSGDIGEMLAAWPSSDVVQASWNAGDPRSDAHAERFLVTHGSLRPLAARGPVATDPAVRAELSAQIGVDLEAPGVLADILVGAALANNTDGIVLVSSTDTSRIERHAALVGRADILQAGRRLAAALQADNPPPPAASTT